VERDSILCLRVSGFLVPHSAFGHVVRMARSGSARDKVSMA
jgi:hypothetical protein